MRLPKNSRPPSLRPRLGPSAPTPSATCRSYSPRRFAPSSPRCSASTSKWAWLGSGTCITITSVAYWPTKWASARRSKPWPLWKSSAGNALKRVPALWSAPPRSSRTGAAKPAASRPPSRSSPTTDSPGNPRPNTSSASTSSSPPTAPSPGTWVPSRWSIGARPRAMKGRILRTRAPRPLRP